MRQGCRRSSGSGYNFAYLDEGTKRMIRRAILKAIAVPGYQVPFASREMPMPYGWGTGGVQVTAAILGRSDVLKVIDQGADDTTNAVSIRRFFARTAGVATTTRTTEATVIQTRHRIPETPLSEGQILVYQVPIPEPLRFLEPRETETRQLHALAEYGAHAREALRGHQPPRPHRHHLRVSGGGRRPLRDGPVADAEIRQSQDGPIARRSSCSARDASGGSTRCRPTPASAASISRIIRSACRAFTEPCALCGARGHYLDEVVIDDAGGRMYVCSDTDICETRAAEGRATNDDAPLLSAHGLDQGLRQPARLRGHRPSTRPRRGAGDRGRIGVGQVDAALPDCRRAGARFRARSPTGCATAGCATSPNSARPERRRADAHRLGLRPPGRRARACAWRSRPAAMSASG